MIGLYAHHHGSGHLYRCRTIARALAEYGEPAQVLSSREGADVLLPDDAGATAADHPELSAGGTLHYAPYQHAGMRERMARLAEWIAHHRPRAFYVDVSVEVAAFVRLMGVPVVTLAMPGVRSDAPHQLGYRLSEAVIAAWPQWVEVPAHLAEHRARLHAVGGISRLSRLPGVARSPRRVVVLAGAGGDNWDADTWEAVRRACLDYEFEFLGRDRYVADPTRALSEAAVVVAAAGQNSVADLATTHTPAIILPQDRPFAEQHATARLLADAHLALVHSTFPAPYDWPSLLSRARALPDRWERWECEGAAHRAARVIAEVAAR